MVLQESLANRKFQNDSERSDLGNCASFRMEIPVQENICVDLGVGETEHVL